MDFYTQNAQNNRSGRLLEIIAYPKAHAFAVTRETSWGASGMQPSERQLVEHVPQCELCDDASCLDRWL